MDYSSLPNKVYTHPWRSGQGLNSLPPNDFFSLISHYYLPRTMCLKQRR